MGIASWRAPNRQSQYSTPMADSSQDSRGNLEHIYTPGTSVLHAPTHTVSLEMTRGYPMEQSSYQLWPQSSNSY